MTRNDRRFQAGARGCDEAGLDIVRGNDHRSRYPAAWPLEACSCKRHGRSAFDPAASKRHSRSRQVGLDEFYSRRGILYRERSHPCCWMTFRID